MDSVDVDGSSPLHKACFSGSSECTKLLLDAGFVNFACLALDSHTFSAGANVDLADSDKVTALHKACFNNNAECARLLLKHGATVDATDKFGSTALHKAAFGGSSGCCQVLLDNKAVATSFDGEGYTPAHLAAHRKHSEALKVLVTSEPKLASMMSQNSRSETPVLLAARVGSASCVAVLLAAGANAEAEANNGESALAAARRGGHEEVVSLLSKGKEEGRVQAEANVAVAVAQDADRTADAVVVDRWGFLGAQVLDKDEELHKRKEVEREIKWVEMRNNWDRWVLRRSKKLKQRCLKGIPVRETCSFFFFFSPMFISLSLGRIRFDLLRGFDCLELESCVDPRRIIIIRSLFLVKKRHRRWK